MHTNSLSSSNTSNVANTSTLNAGSLAEPKELISSETRTTAAVIAAPTKISFSVTRREKSRVVSTNNSLGGDGSGKIHEEEDDEEDEHKVARKRAILSFENGIAVDAEPCIKKAKKLLVIPVLRLSTQLQIERLQKLVAEGEASESDKARLVLLLDSAGVQSVYGDGKDQEKFELFGTQQQSSVPTVVMADDVDPDYNSVPVGEFGLAFLRGCGWKNAQSCIGRSNPQAVPLRVSTPRPKGLGLGAALPSVPPSDASSTAKKCLEGNNGNEAQDMLTLGKHSYVKCLAGLHRGALGQVRSMDEENASIFIELAWPPGSVGKTVRVSQLTVELVPQKEFRERLKAASRGGVDTAIPTTQNGRRSGRVRV